MDEISKYSNELRLIKSLLIVTSLQKREDLKAKNLILKFDKELDWASLENLMIDKEVWNYIHNERGYDPKLVFCHPQILLYNPVTSLYYRGLCGLSIKGAKHYVGAIENLEKGNPRARIDYDKALKMARTYNTFISSIIKNSTTWTLENGYRTIIGTLGITLDGIMRNEVGKIAEERIKTLILEWLNSRNLIIEPSLKDDSIYPDLSYEFLLRNGINMKFGSEPDISFFRGEELLAVIEIKGGTEPAGALERYGAATKSFHHSLENSKRCRNFYLAAIFTNELKRRINEDRLVEKAFDIMTILDNPKNRTEFFQEVFHHSLRII